MHKQIIFLCLLFSFCCCEPCSKKHSVDITNGITASDGSIRMDDVIYEKGEYFVEDEKTWGCICKKKMCIRKCCNSTQVLRYGNKCVNGHEDINMNFNESQSKWMFNPQSDYMFYGNDCPDKLNVTPAWNMEQLAMHKNGSLSDVKFKMMYTIDYYCIDYNKRREKVIALLCLRLETSDNSNSNSIIYGMIISMPFLLVTFLVYLILPEKNLHRKSLMSYVSTLLGADISFVIMQFISGNIPDVSCHILGYLILFFFLASFFWMNVMCIDMWLAFGGIRKFLTKKTTEEKRFIIYSIYAWGTPIIHVIIVLLLNTYSDENASYHPSIGQQYCFLGGGLPLLYYYYLPMAIILAINVGLFISTTMRIRKLQRETSVLTQTDSKRHSYEDDKQKFNLYLKLTFAMGINWIMELISWAVDYAEPNTSPWAWHITDCGNALYGVVIFFIFVFKKKIWKSLKKRYYTWMGKSRVFDSVATSMTRSTRPTNYSIADSTTGKTDEETSDVLTLQCTSTVEQNNQ